MILHEDNPKDSTKKLLELIHEFSKLAGYKIEKLVSFLYTDNNLPVKEMNKTIPFTLASKIEKKNPQNEFNHRG